MKRFVVLAAALAWSTAVLAQSSPPANGPVMYGGKPLVQVKPRAKDTTARAVPRDGKPQSTAVRLQGCLDIDDGT